MAQYPLQAEGIASSHQVALAQKTVAPIHRTHRSVLLTVPGAAAVPSSRRVRSILRGDCPFA
jgi:hypothetical protein